MTQIIHITWDGPFTFKELDKINNEKIDKGVYQIYGSHPVYGSNVLLYIGKASGETFKERLIIEMNNWEEEENIEQIKIYVGRFYGKETPDDKEWSKQIDMVEKLLICSHFPTYNLSRKGSYKDPALFDLHIYNWDEYRNLLPEVSGGRWTDKFDAIEKKEKWHRYGEN
ncbi:MAG: hypothetical protein WCF59_07520 [Desulfobaccales bacterium]